MRGRLRAGQKWSTGHHHGGVQQDVLRPAAAVSCPRLSCSSGHSLNVQGKDGAQLTAHVEEHVCIIAVRLPSLSASWHDHASVCIG
jgi:hypothetical protein